MKGKDSSSVLVYVAGISVTCGWKLQKKNTKFYIKKEISLPNFVFIFTQPCVELI